MPKSKPKPPKKIKSKTDDITSKQADDYEDDDDDPIFWPIILKCWRWISSHKKKSAIIVGVTLTVLLFAWPVTRYAFSGLFVKQDLGITVSDAEDSLPVSFAKVNVDGKEYTTDGEGKVYIENLPTGRRTIIASKQYYQTASHQFTLRIFRNASNIKITLSTKEYKIPVQVRDAVTGARIAGAHLRTNEIQSLTNKNGEATITLPKSDQPVDMVINKSGYQVLKTKLTFTQEVIKYNSFLIAPE